MKKVNLISLAAIIGLIISISSCKKDEVTPKSGEFKITIENVFDAKEYSSTGTTGLITPGNSESFSFNAGKGEYLSFATMFVQSNDLFFAPEDMGIALYDNNGMVVTGNVTSKIFLWDAGTEVNEEPGLGANQAPRQTAVNTGASESNPVNMVNDAFTYQATNSVIKVEIANTGGTMFTVTITNVSNGTALETPFAPGVWVINSENQKPIFTKGIKATEKLERLAEDGENSMLNTNLAEMSGFFSPYAPGAYSVGNENKVFTIDQPSSSSLEKLAEDGDPSGFINVFNTPDGSSSAGALLPGNSYSFTITAKEGDKLSFAAMLVQSNDWFIGANNIDMFSNGTALTGDITMKIKLYDAGTEVDEYAGAGINQPLRQTSANTGDDENGNVTEESSPSANIPMLKDMVKVTITQM